VLDQRQSSALHTRFAFFALRSIHLISPALPSESALAPPHCPNTWRAEPQKEKCPFHFRKNHPRENKKQGTFFLFGVAEWSEVVVGLSWSVQFNLELPRAPRVRHHLF